MLFLPILSFSLLVGANGFFMSFVSLYLKNLDMQPFDIGLVQSSSALGLLISTLHAQKLVFKIGHNRSFALVCLLLAAVTSLLIVIPPSFWFLPRFLVGLIMGSFWVLIESWILIDFKNQKGLAMGCYVMVVDLSMALGQLLLPWVDHRANFAVFLVDGLFLAALILIGFRSRPDPVIPDNPEKGVFLPFLFKSPVGVLASFAAGLILGSLYSFMPIYIADRGFNPGYLMSCMILGGASLQLLVGKISDHFDRRKLLIILVCLGSICAYVSDRATSLFTFSAAIFFFGGACFTIYPVAAAIASDDGGHQNLAKMAGVVLFAYSIGAVIGPLATSILKARSFDYMQLAVIVPSAMLIVSIVISKLLGISRTQGACR